MTMENQENYFEIMPIEEIANIENQPNFKKLELSPSQRIQMSGLAQQMPAVLATDVLSKAYVVRLPEGLSGAYRLMSYKDGGVGSLVLGEKNIVAHASFHEASAQAAVLGAFSIMSVASGQYFLAQISNELNVIGQKIDKILEFLYGDKKAELMAEVSFTNYAYKNYSSIMEHKEQRVATLIGLQDARKIAMKDIEFYQSDLDSTVTKNKDADIKDMVDKSFQIKDCLTLSLQLYAMSSLLEVYYAQNYDSNYIQYIEEESVAYIAKCESRILSSFSRLAARVQSFKETMLKKVDKPALEKRINGVIEYYGGGTESDMRKSFREILHISERSAEYYINNDGAIYLKTG